MCFVLSGNGAPGRTKSKQEETGISKYGIRFEVAFKSPRLWKKETLAQRLTFSCFNPHTFKKHPTLVYNGGGSWKLGARSRMLKIP
jgi:hypothetical protein